jgi:hypothetical protein
VRERCNALDVLKKPREKHLLVHENGNESGCGHVTAAQVTSSKRKKKLERRAVSVSAETG